MTKFKVHAIPIHMEEFKLVKQKQLELSTKRNKMLTLTEVSNEIVKRGLQSMKNEEELKKIEELHNVTT